MKAMKRLSNAELRQLVQKEVVEVWAPIFDELGGGHGPVHGMNVFLGGKKEEVKPEPEDPDESKREEPDPETTTSATLPTPVNSRTSQAVGGVQFHDASSPMIHEQLLGVLPGAKVWVPASFGSETGPVQGTITKIDSHHPTGRVKVSVQVPSESGGKRIRVMWADDLSLHDPRPPLRLQVVKPMPALEQISPDPPEAPSVIQQSLDRISSRGLSLTNPAREPSRRHWRSLSSARRSPRMGQYQMSSAPLAPSGGRRQLFGM